MNDLQSTFDILFASFSSTGCCFPSGITLKIVAFLERLRVCVVVFIYEKENWQCLYRLWHATLHHALITCSNVSRAGKGNIAYHDRDTCDFSQGYMTKNQPMAVPF